MAITKIILIAVLLWIGVHLLLFGYLKRRIAAAKAKALARPPVRVEGGCHCKAVRFQFSTRPHVTVMDCNCSICAATAFQHLIIPHSDFTLVSGKDSLTTYRFGSGAAEHLFCSHCGIKSFYQPRSHPDSWSVNYRCLDDAHELIPLYQPFDGKNWEAAKAALDKAG
jgi:hypothetical protein